MENEEVIRQIVIMGNEYKFNQVKGSEFEQAVKFYIEQLKATNDSKPIDKLIKTYETDVKEYKKMYDKYHKQGNHQKAMDNYLPMITLEKSVKDLKGYDKWRSLTPKGIARKAWNEATNDSTAKLKERIDFLETRFRHYHVNNRENDACKQCGLDLRDKIHCRADL